MLADSTCDPIRLLCPFHVFRQEIVETIMQIPKADWFLAPVKKKDCTSGLRGRARAGMAVVGPGVGVGVGVGVSALFGRQPKVALWWATGSGAARGGEKRRKKGGTTMVFYGP